MSQGNESDPNDYLWSPLFMAYAAAPVDNINSLPMLACQYRGILQVNCNGWSDFVDAQHINGTVKLHHGENDWLKDGQWHHYAAVFTPTTGTVYIDGEIANQWILDGESEGQVLAGLFSNGNELQYICLGGNQAWGWGDPDPGFSFDEIAIYNQELNQADIQAIVKRKK